MVDNIPEEVLVVDLKPLALLFTAVSSALMFKAVCERPDHRSTSVSGSVAGWLEDAARGETGSG